MKTVFLPRFGEVELRDTLIPRISSGEILVRMRACGICGTDVEKVEGPFVTSPVLGHEVAGEVAQVGEGVRELREGDRVFVHH